MRAKRLPPWPRFYSVLPNSSKKNPNCARPAPRLFCVTCIGCDRLAVPASLPCPAGQGIVYEALDMSQLPEYTVGGTIHLVVNNQARGEGQSRMRALRSDTSPWCGSPSVLAAVTCHSHGAVAAAPSAPCCVCCSLDWLPTCRPTRALACAPAASVAPAPASLEHLPLTSIPTHAPCASTASRRWPSPPTPRSRAAARTARVRQQPRAACRVLLLRHA